MRSLSELNRMALELIETGKQNFVGGFWRNRTRTSSLLGYGTWEQVPDDIKKRVNEIGQAARKRAQDAKVTKKPKPFVLSETVLQEIWEGVTLVPKDINKRDERRIRVYITKQSGFNPDKILLGIESRKER